MRAFGTFPTVMLGLSKFDPSDKDCVRTAPRPRGFEEASASGQHPALAQRLEGALQQMQQLLAQNPANSFARYGLAMEFVKAGDLSRAVDQFKAVLEADPSYAYAYFHGGQTLEKLGELDQARELYRQGLETTRACKAQSVREDPCLRSGLVWPFKSFLALAIYSLLKAVHF